MAMYSELPVYKTAYQLLLRLVSMSPSWQRDYRYTLGQEVKQELVDLLVLICRANSVRDKGAVLQEAREATERVKIYVRLLRDLRQIGENPYASLADEMGSLSKQLAAWQAKAAPQ